MRIRHLPAWEFSRQRWANGHGWTREILHATDAERGGWRASIAEIDHDGEFSRFPERRRVLVLLQGNGVELAIDGTPTRIEPPHGRALFAGDAAVHARLLDGPVHVFNLIHEPARVDAEVLHRPLVGAMVFFDTGDDWLLLLLRGQAELRSGAQQATLEAGDAALLSGSDAGSEQRAIIDGGGELLLVRLTPRPSPARTAPVR